MYTYCHSVRLLSRSTSIATGSCPSTWSYRSRKKSITSSHDSRGKMTVSAMSLGDIYVNMTIFYQTVLLPSNRSMYFETGNRQMTESSDQLYKPYKSAGILTIHIMVGLPL
jgi:hypothetical protein